MNFEFFYLEFFSGCFDTSGSMVPHLVPEIEGGYPERDGEEGEEGEGGEGLVLEYSRSWMCTVAKSKKMCDFLHLGINSTQYQKRMSAMNQEANISFEMGIR